MQVTEVNHPRELEGLQLVWQNLSLQGGSGSLVHSFAWLTNVIEHAVRELRPRLFVVNDGSRVIGMVPLLEHIATTRFSRTKVLTSVPMPQGGGFSPIGTQHAATLLATFRYLAQHGHSWDELRLASIDPDSSIRRRIDTALEITCLKHHVTRSCEISEIHLPHSVMNVEKHEAQRHALGLQYEHLANRSPMRATETANVDLPDRLIAAMTRLSVESSIDGLGRADFAIPFVRSFHESAENAGVADIHLLRRGDELVAFQYNFAEEGRVLPVFRGELGDATRGSVKPILSAAMMHCCQLRGDTYADSEVLSDNESALAIESSAQADYLVLSPQRRRTFPSLRNFTSAMNIAR